MKVIQINDVKMEESTNPLFQGGRVQSQLLIDSESAKAMRVGVLTFSPGVVTKFHTHEFEQVLYVVWGKGRVATETEESIVLPGTIIFFPEGERHLHGATDDMPFVQMTIANPGKAKIG